MAWTNLREEIEAEFAELEQRYMDAVELYGVARLAYLKERERVKWQQIKSSQTLMQLRRLKARMRYAKHCVELRARMREQYLDTKVNQPERHAKKLEYIAQWNAAHKDKRREYSLRAYRKRCADPVKKEAMLLRKREWVRKRRQDPEYRAKQLEIQRRCIARKKTTEEGSKKFAEQNHVRTRRWRYTHLEEARARERERARTRRVDPEYVGYHRQHQKDYRVKQRLTDPQYAEKERARRKAYIERLRHDPEAWERYCALARARNARYVAKRRAVAIKAAA